MGTAVLARGELGHLWWRLPGVEKPRVAGAVDFRGAQWVAASSANWRRADRPDDYGIDRVVIHVTQGSYRSAVKVFQDPAHGAAAHYIVREDGHITQMIRELDVAFHAGNRGTTSGASASSTRASWSAPRRSRTPCTRPRRG